VLTQTYRQNDSGSRAFGIGSSHSYELFLVGDTNPYTFMDLILPDGGRIHFVRTTRTATATRSTTPWPRNKRYAEEARVVLPNGSIRSFRTGDSVAQFIKDVRP
jgi:hypothetical protein